MIRMQSQGSHGLVRDFATCGILAMIQLTRNLAHFRRRGSGQSDEAPFRNPAAARRDHAARPFVQVRPELTEGLPEFTILFHTSHYQNSNAFRECVEIGSN